MFVRSIHVYPIKSTAGMDLSSAAIDERGFAHDRRWMVVDGDGRFLTGREISRIVLIRAVPEGEGLRVEAPSMPPLRMPAPNERGERMHVTVWDDRVDAARADERSETWFSEFLGRPVRLAMVDARSERVAESGHGATAEDAIGFADGYPFLAISQESLDALNAKMPTSIPMSRFRPNLVIEGAEPHGEDAWRRIRIGEVEFEALKPCTRCVFTTVDPETGQRDPAGEPLRTLRTYRRSPGGIRFGMNLVARGRGVVRVGDRVERL
jgi:uncharacterized protein YcbX